MGLIVYVYRNPLGDCTNGGASSRFTRLCVTNADGPFQPGPDAPAAVLECHHPGCLRLVPQDLRDRRQWAMFGGNFASSSDSRFTALAESLLGHRFYGAVAIHDRVEG